MSEPKPFASLSSGLLARKGAARPAMRPQGFGQVGNGLDDLGWNDMGFDPPKAAPSERDGEHDAFGEHIVEHPRALHPTGLSPVESPVHHQQAEIEDRFAADARDDAEEIDEEFDETAELYDPDAPFVSAEDDVEDDEDATAGAAATALFDPAPTPPPFAPRKQMALEPLPVEPEPEPETATQAPGPAVVQPPEPAVALAPVPAAAPAPRREPRVRARASHKGKAAFTLRLDPERHLKLRLACALDGRSAQMLVTAALDQLLAAMPELEDMAEKANRKG